MEHTEGSARGLIEEAGHIVCGADFIMVALESFAVGNEIEPDALRVVGNELHLAAQLIREARNTL